MGMHGSQDNGEDAPELFGMVPCVVPHGHMGVWCVRY